MKKLIEEKVAKLESLRVSTGVLKPFEDCSDGLLTTLRFSFKDSAGKAKCIFISSITDIRMSKRFLREYIVLNTGELRYNITCLDLESIFAHFQRVIALNKENLILGTSDGIGGISRVIQAKKDKRDEAENLKNAALKDLDTLRGKFDGVLAIAKEYSRMRGLESGQEHVQELFKNLGISNVFSELDLNSSKGKRIEGIKRVLDSLLEANGMVLLQNLFCAVNSLLLCDLYSPSELFESVKALADVGFCKMTKLHGTWVVTRNTDGIDFGNILKDTKNGPITLVSYSRDYQLPIALAEVQLNMAEASGLIVRDDSVQQVQYFYNDFKAFDM
ncbi:conserved hypothetical protein [Theileria equi strain WA]|uniref:Vacuolar protein-sorting-associated protein 36 n=1 Tax=Theileria equi strain WA TaxID=1537102 RepID=L1LFQ8_THEEQ|nr:conserved hypothetical protein [Theileria equi strain WA]EKX74109.1 conserved hypothetical protein [Theileria equi strain WA]|eukprot:XP_004833561.1 conserved hypothetical protein [Theileria equi strain WA]